jgi:hypothetical protein
VTLFRLSRLISPLSRHHMLVVVLRSPKPTTMANGLIQEWLQSIFFVLRFYFVLHISSLSLPNGISCELSAYYFNYTGLLATRYLDFALRSCIEIAPKPPNIHCVGRCRQDGKMGARFRAHNSAL